MVSTIPILPDSFVTEAEAQAYIGRGADFDAAGADAVMIGINSAVGYMQNATGRDLKAKTHSMRRTAQVTFDPGTSRLLADGASAAEAMALVRVGDPVTVVGSTFPVHAFVTVAWDGSGVKVAGAAALGSGSGTATFGDGGFLMDGEGGRTIELPDNPLKTISAAWYANGLGGWTLMDTTNAIIDYRMSRVTLLNDYWRHGTSNLLVEARVGYEAPSGSSPGDPRDWSVLQTIQLRLAQIYYMEWLTPMGRNREASAGNATASRINDAVPADLKAMLRQYARVGA